MSKFRFLFALILSLTLFSGKVWAATPTIAVTKTAPTGGGSLAAAIAYANANPGTRITFAVKTAPLSGGVHHFVLPSASTINATVLFDGTTQTALTGNTNASGPEVSIEGLGEIRAAATLRNVSCSWNSTLSNTGSLTIDSASRFIWTGGTLSGIVRNQGTFQTQFASKVAGKIAGGTITNTGTLILGDANRTATLISLQADPVAPSRKTTINNNGKCIVYSGLDVAGSSDSPFNNTKSFEQRGSGTARLLITFNNSGLVVAKEGKLVLGTKGVHTGILRATAPGYIWLSMSRSGRAILRDKARFEGNGTGKASQGGTIRIGYAQLEGEITVNCTLFIADDGSSLQSTDCVPSLIALDCGRISGTGVVRWIRGIITGYLVLTPDCAPKFRWEGGILQGTLNIGVNCLVSIVNSADCFDFSGNGVKSIVGGAVQNAGTVELGVAGTTPADVLLSLSPSANGSRLTSIVNSGIWTLFAGSRTEGNGIMLNLGVLQGSGTLASLSNAGTLSPGGDKLGSITITGDLTLESSSRLLVDIFGRATNQLDKIIVCGFLSCNGEIVVCSNRCQIYDNDCFPVIEHSGASGSFASATAPFRPEVASDKVNLIVDAKLNSATITSPANGSSVATFTEIYGQAFGTATGTAGGYVQATLRRMSDRKYWNGSTWVVAQALLPTVFDADGTTWRINSQLPTGSNLIDDVYAITAVPFDCNGCKGIPASSRFTLCQVAPAPPASSVQLSSSSANCFGVVTLTFTGALNSSASNPSNYSVTVDGNVVSIASVQQKNTSTVEITLDEGGLPVDAKVVVNYRLQDAGGRTLEGQASMTAR